MWLSSLFLIIVGAGVFSLDARLTGRLVPRTKGK